AGGPPASAGPGRCRAGAAVPPPDARSPSRVRRGRGRGWDRAAERSREGRGAAPPASPRGVSATPAGRLRLGRAERLVHLGNGVEKLLPVGRVIALLGRAGSLGR